MESETSGLKDAKKKFDRANKALSENKHEEAVALLSDAIELCPRNAHYVLKRGSTLLHQKKYKKAMKDAILSRTLEPENDAASILLAKCHLAYGNFIIAESILRNLECKETKNIDSLLSSLQHLRLDGIRILQLYLAHTYNEANTMCDKLLLIAPECYSAKLIKGLSLIMMAQHAEAETIVDGLLEVNPCDYDALFAKAQLMYYAEHYDEARVMLEQISVRHLLKVDESAQAVINDIVNFIRANDSAQTAVEKKDYKTAISLYENALTIDVKHKVGNSKIHLMLALVHAKQRHLFKALDHCEQAILFDPLNSKAIMKRIDLLEKLTFIEMALERAKVIYSALPSSDGQVIERLKGQLNLSRIHGHYFSLSILPNASDAEVRLAYKKKLKHFELCDELVVVTSMMTMKRKELDQAFQVLSDKMKRRQYDQQIGIVHNDQSSSGSDEELIAELKSVKTNLKIGMSIHSTESKNSFPKENFVFVEKPHSSSVTGNGSDEQDVNVDIDVKLVEKCTKDATDAAHVKNGEVSRPTSDQISIEAEMIYKTGIQFYCGSGRRSYKDAVECFSKAIALCPTEPKYYISRSDAYLKESRFTNALTDAMKAVELESNNVGAYLKILACNLIFGNISQAEEVVGRLKTLDPEKYKQWLDRLELFKQTIENAEQLLSVKKYEATVSCCDEILEKSPEFVRIKLIKAEALAELCNETARDIVDKILSTDAHNADALYVKALIAYHESNFGTARQILEVVKTEDSLRLKSEALVKRMEFLKPEERRKEELKTAEATCSKEVKACSTDKHDISSSKPNRYLDGAKSKFKLGHTDDALKDCDQAILLDPKNGDAYVTRAEIHMKLALLDEAVADWKAVSDADVTVSSQETRDNACKMLDELKRDPFAVLSIAATSSFDQIMQSRHRLVLIRHPDGQVATSAKRMNESRFQAVQQALHSMNC
ncbi:DnaJ -like protein subfamily C member 7 [Halotydeus destructor]|nr:DnaJ -like protein subfamily C member 7 [Halotydeus destructor]